jgi:hypothetical protein
MKEGGKEGGRERGRERKREGRSSSRLYPEQGPGLSCLNISEIP